jgi:hypothetical protein
METFVTKIYTLDEFTKIVEGQIFGFKNMNPIDLMDSFDGVKERGEESERHARKIMKMMGVSNAEVDSFGERLGKELEENPADFQENLIVGTTYFINEFFKNKTIAKDGYCLKSNLEGKAVQLRNNEDMLGFVSELIEDSPRFLMVDFGEKEGAVKIDVDELTFG